MARRWRPAAAGAADIQEAANLLRTGRYEECARQAAAALEGEEPGEDWYALKIRAEMARGNYERALDSLKEATRRHPASLTLFLIGRDVRRFQNLGNREEEGAERHRAVDLERAAAVRHARGPVALGRYFLLRGADPKKVLDQFYDVAIKREPRVVDAYLATAELALDKQDYALAAETLRKAPKAAAEDPRFHYLLALAYSARGPARADKELAEALKINPNHVDSLLLQIDHWSIPRSTPKRRRSSSRSVTVNPHEPRAFAYQAVLAHLRGDRDGEAAARRSALEPWAGNPEVDS